MQNVTPPYHGYKQSVTTTIVAFTALAFVLQNLTYFWFKNNFFIEYLGLSSYRVESGFLWTLLSYAILHEPIILGGFWHILFNLAVIFFTGQALEKDIGGKRVAQLYILSVLIAGLAWLSFNWGNGAILLGASGGALGLLTVFCLLHAHERMLFLLFFIIPIRLKPKWLLTGVIAFELLSFIAYELGGRHNIAHTAHLGGILAGFIFYFCFKLKTIQLVSIPKTQRLASPNFKINFHQTDIQAQTDRILDKISAHGFQSLTAKEKEILNQFKKKP